MNAIGKIFAGLFGGNEKNSANADIYREWDRLRASAMTPAERSEIDAIFSRQL